MSAYIHSELPWSYLPGNGYDWFLPRVDPAKASICFEECTLPDGCCEHDERCPFYRSHHRQQAMAKASYRMRNKWQRELDTAVERIVAEREADPYADHAA